MIAFLIRYRFAILLGAGASAIILFMLHYDKLGDKAAAFDDLVARQATQDAQQNHSDTVGMNLETGMNDYRPAARNLDREVKNATDRNTGNRFAADSVRRTTGRIAAGEAARQRANPVR